MASLRTTGSRGSPDRHFYVAHPFWRQTSNGIIFRCKASDSPETAFEEVSLDRSRDVRLHQVGGKPAEATSPAAAHRESHLRLPVLLDGTAALVRPNSTQASSAAGASRYSVAGTRRASGSGEDVVATPGRGGATGRVVQGIAASMKGTAFTRRNPTVDRPATSAEPRVIRPTGR